MAIFKVLFLCSFIFPAIYASEDCRFSTCSNDSIIIRFPFQLEGEQQPRNCGYPGFNLICTNDGSRTILKLPYSGEFYVSNINYLTQQIQVYDPDGCLPKRLLSLNLSGSPFVATFRRNYTFISCPYKISESNFTPINCLSNSTNSVLAVPSARLDGSLPESCFFISRLSVPLARPEQYDETSRDDLDQDLRLRWYQPDCRICELNGICGPDSRNEDQIRCVSDSRTGNSNDGLRVFRIIILSIAAPAVICVLVLACLACIMDRRGRGGRFAGGQRSAPTAVSPQAAITTVGLDESTIESYEKVVIGESRRLPGPNDGSCSICLSEYNTKETIRLIPECKHCFHADCIDEWLRMNSSCPVCRNTPSPSSLHVIVSSDA
ncbi:hypothetical protein L6164_004024 [Bauhinia variegata]|uniref:Uncharacterized protein n=1 Tax=Bauhinia variegata TaxID=167791 RepID=A0ACB9Q5T9_BAUVA|nr:hypothetical protein L6164_004024 [Bauhinia variegata]